MEAIKEKTMLEKLTLGFAAVLTLVQLAVLMDCFTLTNLLWLLAAGALTWLLLRGGKEEYFWYAFLGVGAAALIGFFAGFSRELYAIVTVRGEYRNTAENFFTVLPGLLVLAGALGVTALGGLLFASKFPAIGDRLRRLWYLPALLFALALLYALCLGLFVTLYGYGSRWAGFSEFASLRTLLWGGFAFCLGLRAAGHEELPTRAAAGDAEGGAPAVKYCSAAKLLFLTLITLGIWMLVWIYRTTAALSPYEDRHPRKPWLEVICCLLLPFYVVYWLYKSAQLAALAADGEEDRHFSTLCLILGALLTPVSMLLVQDKLNVLADREPEIEVELEVVEPEPAEEEPVREAVAAEEPVPAEEEPAPVEEEPVPAAEEAVPAEEAPVPEEEAPASAAEEPAPVVEEAPEPAAEEKPKRKRTRKAAKDE